MARLFDGTDDVIQVAVGAADITFGTMAALVRRNADSVYHAVLALFTSGGTRRLALFLNDVNRVSWDDTVNEGQTGSVTVVAADGWVLAVARKATGSVAPRFSTYNYGTNTFTHANGSPNIPDNTAAGAGGFWKIGKSTSGSFLNGDVKLAAAWSRSLSDSEVENLPFSLMGWYAAAPGALWLLDQSLTTQNVIDLTGGGANQTAITGTAIAPTSVPVFGYGHEVVAVRGQASAAVRFRRNQYLRTGSRGAMGGR